MTFFRREDKTGQTEERSTILKYAKLKNRTSTMQFSSFCFSLSCLFCMYIAFYVPRVSFASHLLFNIKLTPQIQARSTRSKEQYKEKKQNKPMWFGFTQILFHPGTCSLSFLKVKLIHLHKCKKLIHLPAASCMPHFRMLKF